MLGVINSTHAQGPYILIGWSFGGILAYEISRQLIEKNKTVAFVGLLDTHISPISVKAPQSPHPKIFVDRHAAHQFALSAYKPKKIAIPINVYAAEEKSLTKAWGKANPYLGWDQILDINNIHVTKVPGNHMSMMSTHIRALGTAITKALGLLGEKR